MIRIISHLLSSTCGFDELFSELCKQRNVLINTFYSPFQLGFNSIKSLFTFYFNISKLCKTWKCDYLKHILLKKLQ